MLRECDSCSTIGDDITANTGRNEYFSQPVERLEWLQIESGQDVRRCRECGALFHWQDLPQHYGSGNEWEERLIRLTPAQAELTRAILLAAGPPAEPLKWLESCFEVLKFDLAILLLNWTAKKHPDLARALIPALVNRLERHNDGNIAGIIWTWAGKDRARIGELLQILYARGDALGKNCHYMRGRCEELLAGPRKAP